MKERLKNLWNMLSFRTMWDDQEEEDWEDYDQKDNYVSGEVYADDTKKLAGIGSGIVYLAIIALVVIAVAAYLIMSRFHLYTGYSVSAFYPAEDIAGTRYEKLGNGFIKYGSDGVSFVNGKNAVNELTVLLVVGKVKFHFINRINHFVPLIAPCFNGRSFLTVGTANKSIKQQIIGDKVFFYSPNADTYIVAVCSTWLIISRH